MLKLKDRVYCAALGLVSFYGVCVSEMFVICRFLITNFYVVSEDLDGVIG